MPTKTFSQVISDAISSFDAIYDALQSKLVTPSGTSPLTDAQRSNGTIPTGSYAGYITNQLYRVGTAITEGGVTTMTGVTPVTVNGVIASYAGVASNVSDGVYGTATSSAIPVTFTIANPGYYDTQSTVIGNVPILSSISLTGSNISSYAVVENSVTEYVVKDNTNHYPLLEVHIPQGSVDVTYGTPAITESITNTLTIDSDNSTITNATLGSGNTGDYELVITKNATYNGNVTGVTPTVVTSPGFITSSNVTVPSPAFQITTNMAESSETIYIPAGTVSGTLSNTADVSLTGSSGLSLLSSAPAEGSYYTLTAAATGLSVIGTTTAGYVAAGSNITLGSVADKSKAFYLPAGEVPDSTIALAADQWAYTDTGSALTTTVTNYPVTFSINQGSAAQTTVVPGYIEDTAYSVTVTGSKTMYIKAGAITETANIAVDTANISGDTGIITTGSSGTYHISVPITASVSTTTPITQGYISDASTQITHVGDSETLSFSVAGGSADITPTLSAVVSDAGNDDGDAEVQNEEMFYDEQPQSGDYYTITASATTSVNPGFMTSGNVTVGASAVKYLKKATFSYVTMADSEDSFLQVTSGGYVPSGIISDIASISGNIDTAVVAVNLGDASSGILTGSQTSGLDYYTISATKGTTDAGFISSTQGSVSGTVYVLHGSESLATVFNSSTITSGVDPVLDSTHAKYTLDVTHSITNTLTFQEGYIKSDDITMNGTDDVTTKTITDSTTLDIGEGVYDITSKAFTVGVTNTAGLLTSSSGYTLTPTMTAAIQVDATTDGYISGTNERQTYNIAANDASITATPIIIKQGAGSIARTGHTANDWSALASGATTSTATLTDNFSTTQSGDYTITLGGYAEAALELDEGYYKISDDSNKLSGGQVELNKTLSVAHGHISVSLTTPTNNVSLVTSGQNPVDLSSILATTAPVSGYVAIGSSVSVDGSISVTEGYVKDIAGDKSFTSITNANTTRYIPTVNLETSSLSAGGTDRTGTAVASGTTVYGTIELGSNDGDIHGSSSYATASTSETGLRDAVILPTKNKFALYDTKIELTANAMGSAVAAELISLENRLAGRAVSA